MCLSKLCEFGSFAKTGPELKHSRCPGCCPVVNSRKLSSSFESESTAGKSTLFSRLPFLGELLLFLSEDAF